MTGAAGAQAAGAESRSDATPLPTRAALVAALAVTLAALAAFLAGRGDEVDARFAATFLCLFSALFLARVIGQLAVRTRQPSWLPPTEQWNLAPYRLLLPTQVAILGLMVWTNLAFWTAGGPPATPRPAVGAAVLAFAGVYAGAMAVRYAVRMLRRPEERWFGGTIPIVFHWVLAAYLTVFGTYHVSY